MPDYDLMLLDYSMPYYTGPEVAKKVTELYSTYREKLVVLDPSLKGSEELLLPLPNMICLTAYQEQTYKNAALKAGMKDFVTKPVQLNPLKKLVYTYSRPL